MSEPEDLILEGAHVATRVARDVWSRYAGSPASPGVPLAAVRRRLELFATALFQRPVAIAPMPLPAPRTWLSRLACGRTPDSQPDALASGTDGSRVYLPPTLTWDASRRFVPGSAAAATPEGREAALDLFRLLTVEQAMRLWRRTPVIAAQLTDDETRDLFLVAEAAAIDRWIALQVPGLGSVLRQTRSDALRRRPSGRHREGAHPLERHVRAVLGADPLVRAVDTGACEEPEDSLAWARQSRQRHGAAGRYQPVMPVSYWGRVLVPSSVVNSSHPPPAEGEAAPRRQRVAEMVRRPRPREAPEGEDDDSSGTWVIRADDPQESVEDPFGLQRPADHDEEADPEGLGDSLSELPEARVVRTAERPREVLRGPEELPRQATAGPAAAGPCGIAYPEWDYRTRCYRLPGAVVREAAAPQGDPAWVLGALARHARLVRRVRARFDRLRPRLVRLKAQRDGPEIDLGAYVTAAADRAAGIAGDGRLHIALRPARRELAVALLLDVSASTDAWVSANRRIVDVEKEALLVVCEALDALGDRYGVYAFSGESAADVAVLSVKAFRERLSGTVRGRIAALDADRYTRLGAPIRHLTALLAREAGAGRLLLVLSDGKPNDTDLYDGPYGVEDTRQAVGEARRQGVTVFCLTVDREAPSYASRVFGTGRFAVLHRPEQLPSVLIDVLRQLIKS
jgi:nitric oxide reductase NorD protein